MPREYELEVRQVASMVNSFSFNPKAFCQEMTHEHRTLQQTFTNLCIEWLKTCASEDYRYDGRNEQSHYISKEIKTAYDNNHTQTSVEYFDDIRLSCV